MNEPDRAQMPAVVEAPPPAMREMAGQATRFAAVGVFNAIFGFSVFNLLLFLGLSPIPANLTSETAGMVFSFLLNRAFAFRHRGSGAFKQALAFFGVTAFAMYVLQNVVIWLLLHAWTWPVDVAVAVVRLFVTVDGGSILRANAAKVAATVVSMTWNFLMYRYVVFRKS